MHRNPQNYKLLKIVEFSKVHENKINIQKLVAFLYVINKHLETKLRQISLTILSQRMSHLRLRVNLTKILKTATHKKTMMKF